MVNVSLVGIEDHGTNENFAAVVTTHLTSVHTFIWQGAPRPSPLVDSDCLLSFRFRLDVIFRSVVGDRRVHDLQQIGWEKALALGTATLTSLTR